MIDPRTLHEIERKIILALRDKVMSIGDLANATDLNIDQVRRGIEWLKYKGLLHLSEKSEKIVQLDTKGIEALTIGLPERILINKLKEVKEISIQELKEELDLDNEFNAAISHAKSKGWITIEKGKVRLVDDKKGKDELLLERLKEPIPYDDLKDELDAYNMLKKRPNYIKEDIKKIVKISLTKEGLALIEQVKAIKERVIDVEGKTPIIYGGRKHPLQDVIDEVREALIGLGFQEIDGNYIQSSFWNFDILFTPQDHPAREMQDTFYLNTKSDEEIDERIVRRVANIHKKGWHYSWDREESKRLVLRTHTTSVTIRYLADNKPEEGSIFSIGRVFRNEKLSYKHLAEFHQVEGIMVNKDVTLRDLMGLQKEFYYKLGLKRVKFWPTYFPYTEPSLQSMVYHERLCKWVELFGMGIFRPEVTAPTGVKNPVLAWGGGLERIAMLKYDLNDVRELYTNRLLWLRSVPKCQL